MSTSILLYSPGTEVVSIVIWELWENGQYVELSALACCSSLPVRPSGRGATRRQEIRNQGSLSAKEGATMKRER